MKDDTQQKELTKAWIELFCFMASSARGCVSEPPIYGPLRLIDSMERIITILGKQEIRNDFLDSERDKIEENKLVVMEDEEAFIELLDELVLDFTKELKKY